MKQIDIAENQQLERLVWNLDKEGGIAPQVANFFSDGKSSLVSLF